MKKDIQTINKEIAYIQDTLYVINGKWKLPILIAIYNGVYRFREIQRYVGAITPKVLSNYLKDLEENKLVIRKVFDSSPVLVEYHITEYAKTLEPMMREMVSWGANHRIKISQESKTIN
ncbi:winged helix-turn-helix transcriptional regulator [Neptunitalea lumnitzerae]|uniref:Transcriptional regulator n=1 Tax=Neptunitalea lumnitzerae TaxID=2965509 RepID=A0ABQ5MJE1_9FLAO|nr:helix-turn-helix domain-containing protein [Neptunitalea sp. Y10]GLB49447.1 transcriptional regulator [Neptunitalea sp. Y10]